MVDLEYSYYFTLRTVILIPTSNSNNLIYSFIIRTSDGETKTTFVEWLSQGRFCILTKLSMCILQGSVELYVAESFLR